MLIKNKNILPKDKSKKWFTLVELIIVITILAILATIAFISFQGYTKNTRDANRLASLDSMNKWLEIYLTKNSVLPHPENPIIIYDNSETVWFQGYFWDDVARLTWFSKTPSDPLDNNKYTYSTSSNYKKFQLLSLMETSDYLAFSNDLFPKSFANWVDYSKRVPKTIGSDLWILLWTWTNNLNRPIQEGLSASFTWVNIDTDTSYKAIINNSKSVSGSGITILKNTLKNAYDSSLIWYWDMETIKYSIYDWKPYVIDLSWNWKDCLLSDWSTQTKWIKWNALIASKSYATTLLCTNLFSNNKPFSLFLTYKVNQLHNEMNDTVSDPNFDKNNSSWIFTIMKLSPSGYLTYNIYNWNYNTWNKTSTSYGRKNLNINVNIENWNIDTLVYDWEKYKFYHNWEYIDFLNVDSHTISTSELNIPRWYTPNSKLYYWDLTIDDTKLYNRALDDSEITKIYNQMR